MLPQKRPPINVTRGVIILCYALSIPTTLFRLGHRAHIQRLWWDDFWALVALASSVMLVTVFFALPTPAFGSQNATSLQIFSRWGTLVSYTCAVWASRMTVAVTIVRLLNPRSRLRRVAFVAAFIFGLFWGTMLMQKIFFCGVRWKEVPKCAIPKYAGITELVTDNLADAWLILGPAYMLWRMKLRRPYHRLISFIFLCGFFTLVSSVVHSVFILFGWPTWIGISGHIQVAVSVIVSNLLVLMTYIYSIFRTSSTPESSTDLANAPTHSPPRDPISLPSSSSSMPTTALTLTTVITTSQWTTTHGGGTAGGMIEEGREEEEEDTHGVSLGSRSRFDHSSSFASSPPLSSSSAAPPGRRTTGEVTSDIEMSSLERSTALSVVSRTS